MKRNGSVNKWRKEPRRKGQIFCDDSFKAQKLYKNYLLPFIILSNLSYWPPPSSDHLRVATTCLQRQLFWGPFFNFYNIKLPLTNDHLSTKATILGSLGWSLYTGLTVDIYFFGWSLVLLFISILKNKRRFFPSNWELSRTEIFDLREIKRVYCEL